MPVSGVSPRAYRPDIDGLRALAIILVVAFHYFELPGGYVGVDVFFVISGYLITGILLADLECARFTLLGFYARRIRRILPPLLVVILVSFFVGWVWLPPYDFRELSKEAYAGALYVANFLIWHQSDYFDASARTKPFLHLWSLGIEEQFYLVWPAFLLLAHKWKNRADLVIVVILLASFLVNLITIQGDQAAAFYSPLSRMWELASGGLLAWYEQSRGESRLRVALAGTGISGPKSYSPIVGMLLILCAAVLYSSRSHFPGYLAVVPVLGAVLVIAGGAGAPLNRTLLSWRPMVSVGKASYSLYLWHWPVLVFATLLFDEEHFKYMNGVCLVVSALLAWATYSGCERPMRRIPINADNTWKFLLAGIGSSMSVAALTILTSSGVLMRPTDSRLITQQYEPPKGGCYLEGRDGYEHDAAVFAPCEIVRFPGRPLVTLLGDSHAYALGWGLKAYLDARQINLVEMPVVDCVPLSARQLQAACGPAYEYVLEKTARDKPDLVVLFAHHLLQSRELDQAIRQAGADDRTSYEALVTWHLAELLRAGAHHVLLVGQMPIWRPKLPLILNQEYLRLGQNAPTRMFTGVGRDSLDFDEALRSASLELRIPYYSLRDQLCDARGCLTRVGEKLPDDLIVFDDGHMTASGASYVLRSGLGQRIESLLAGEK